jgi:hypothetical protein
MPDARNIIECTQIGKHFYCYITSNAAGWALALTWAAIIIILVLVAFGVSIVLENRAYVRDRRAFLDPEESAELRERLERLENGDESPSA